MQKRLIVSIIYLFSVVSSLAAEGIFELFSNTKFKNYTMENGLPSGNCLKVVQGSDGTIWVATLHGIGKFNGYSWTYFNQESKKRKLPSNWLIDLCAEKNKIWFLTDRGTGQISLNDNHIKLLKKVSFGWGRLFVDKTSIYVSNWRGIFKAKPGKKEVVTAVKNADKKSFHEFTACENGFYALADDQDGYFEIKKDKIYHHRIVFNSTERKDIEIRSILNEGNYLIGATKAHGLIKIDKKTKKFIILNNSSELLKSKARCLKKIQLKKKWFYLIGTDDNGVLIFDALFNQVGHWLPQSELPNSSLKSAVIQHIFIDKNKGIWIATEQGLSYFHESNQQHKAHYFYKNALIPENANINSALEISKNHYFIGTENDGLFSYNIASKKTKKIIFDKSSNKTGVVSIRKISKNNFVIASKESVWIYNHLSERAEIIVKFPMPESIFGVQVLNSEQIGIATSHGVVIYSLVKKAIVFQEPPYPKEDHSAQITKDLLMDSDGTIWALRFFNGLVKINIKSNTISKYTPEKITSQGTDFHNITYCEKTKTIFVATSTGIFIHPTRNTKKYKLYNAKNGLIGDFVDRCERTKDAKSFYYSTPIGVYLFDISLEKSFLLHYIQGYRYKWFNDFYISENNELVYTVSNYFGKHALSNALYTSPNSPTVETIHGAIENQKINYNTRLKSTQNTVHFSFQRLNFEENDEIELQYALHPFKKWLPISNGQLDLLDLSSGEYHLGFRNQSLSTGKISAIKHFLFSISTPFYATWWFLGLLILFITAIIYILFYIRMKNKEQLLETRQQLSRDLHDELGANVSSIQIMASMLHSNTEKTNPNLPFIQNITSFSKEISETINDIIWNVNPKFDTWEELTLRMKRYATTTLDAAGINGVFEMNSLPETHHLSHDSKYHIYLIFKEITNNCAKYSKAKQAKISLSLLNKTPVFEFTDNGIGFDLEQMLNKGNGLKNMLKRAEKIKAKLRIASSSGNGTSITLILNL